MFKLVQRPPAEVRTRVTGGGRAGKRHVRHRTISVRLSWRQVSGRATQGPGAVGISGVCVAQWCVQRLWKAVWQSYGINLIGWLYYCTAAFAAGVRCAQLRHDRHAAAALHAWLCRVDLQGVCVGKVW